MDCTREILTLRLASLFAAKTKHSAPPMNESLRRGHSRLCHALKEAASCTAYCLYLQVLSPGTGCYKSVYGLPPVPEVGALCTTALLEVRARPPRARLPLSAGSSARVGSYPHADAVMPNMHAHVRTNAWNWTRTCTLV